MLKLTAPTKTTAQLQAIAASGATGLARKAQAELTARTTEALAQELAQTRAKQSSEGDCSR